MSILKTECCPTNGPNVDFFVLCTPKINENGQKEIWITMDFIYQILPEEEHQTVDQYLKKQGYSRRLIIQIKKE